MFRMDFDNDFDLEIGSIDVKKKIRKNFTQIWKFGEGGSISSSPLLAGNMLVFGCMDNYVYAIDSETGKDIWRFKTNGSIADGSPVYNNGVIYIGSYDRYLYAIDAKKGREIWRFRTSNPKQVYVPPPSEWFEIEVETKIEEDDFTKKDLYKMGLDLSSEEKIFDNVYTTKSEYKTESEYK